MPLLNNTAHGRRWYLRSLISLIVAASVSCLGVSLVFLHQTIRAPVNQTEQLLVVTPGTGAKNLAEQLVSEGFAKSGWSVIAWAILSGTSGTFKAGEYLIPENTSPAQILGKVSRGDVHQRKLTIVEGLRFSQLRDRLKKEKALTRTAVQMPEATLANQLSLSAPSLEGAFFPATYFFRLGDSDTGILKRAARKMEKELLHAWDTRAPNLLLKDPYEALIMASIVEKETSQKKEKPLVAGVFIRRLAENMKLQADPTVIYGLGSEFDGNLRRIHLNDKNNTYNTYRNNGLPPTPIALSGRDSIIAAFNPDSGTAIYFVADGEGGHIFNTSLA